MRTKIIQSNLGGSYLAVTKDARVAIFLELRLVTIGEVLRTLDRSGMKVVVFADDLLIHMSGMFPSPSSEVAEGELGKICMWTARCRFGINSIKRELILLTTKARVSVFHLSRYQGTILEPKLNCRLNVELRPVQSSTPLNRTL